MAHEVPNVPPRRCTHFISQIVLPVHRETVPVIHKSLTVGEVDVSSHDHKHTRALNVQPQASALDHVLPPTFLGSRLAETCEIDIDRVSSSCHRIPIIPQNNSRLNPTYIPTPDMANLLGSSHLQVLFETALQEYEKQTGIALAKHPLAEQLQICDSVESITAVLRKQAEASDESRGKDKVLKPLKKAVSILYKLSAAADFGQDSGMVRS